MDKIISVWRGDSTPPTDYHLWIKTDGSTFVNVGGTWNELSSPTDLEDLKTKVTTAYGIVSTSEFNEFLTNEKKRIAAETQRDKNETIRKKSESSRISQEGKRQSEEYIRITSEKKRISQENTRQTQETTREANEAIRKDNESNRQSEETNRVNTENTRVSQEATRQANEALRINAENDRVSVEKIRVETETSRVNAEANRVNTENTRVSQEATRQTQENTRISNESTRQTNEETRKNNETLRISNETSRKSAESGRVTAESARVKAETGRVSAENARVAAETKREAAETNREKAVDEAVTNAKTATSATETATANAKEATEAANTATANTNAAIESANKAADNANDAAEASRNATDEASKVNIEVSDDDIITITDRKGTQRQMIFYAASEDLASYGIEFDTTVSNPACTRIGNMDYHKSLPVHSLMKGCLLDDDGNIVKYLDPSDWTGETRDGSEGQVMVEIPQHYRKFETDGTKRRVKISTQPLAGFHKVPKMYVSAYQAALDRTNLKLCSIVNTDAQYRGGNNNAGYDGTYRSFLGMPATVVNRTNFRKYARARKADSTEWNCMTYDIQKTLYWLFVIEYATLNSQATYNAALTDEGYHQGGLGAGVTNISNWSDYNGTYPIIPCGVTDSLGNTTGVVTHNVIAADGESTYYAAPVPRYRGVENPFGHLWQWTDGINVRIAPDEANGGDGLSKVYVCSDPAKFTDTSYDGYTYVGDEARSNGWAKEVIFGEYGEIMPKAVGGGSNTYFCDYHYTAIPTSANSLRGVLFGGFANGGTGAGFACAGSNYAPSGAGTPVASRLCFIPE